MANNSATGLLPKTIGWTLFVYICAFAFLNVQIIPPASTTGLDFVLTFIGNLIGFLTLNVEGLPGLVSFILFMTIAVPWSIISFDITGVVGNIITGVGLVAGAVTKLFQWLF